MSTFLRCFVPWTGATLLLVAISAPGPAQEKKYKPFVVTAPDGVTIAAQEWSETFLCQHARVRGRVPAHDRRAARSHATTDDVPLRAFV
jgi:hypothetical protein